MSNNLYYKHGRAACTPGAVLAVAVGLVAAVLMAHAPRPCSAAPDASVSVDTPSPYAAVADDPETRPFVSSSSSSLPTCSGDSIPSDPLFSPRQGDRDAAMGEATVDGRLHPSRVRAVGPVLPADRASRPPPRRHLRGIVLQI